MEFNFYICTVFFVFAMLVWAGYLSLRVPHKIKIISIIICILVFLRYVALFIFCTVNNIIYLYLLKPLFFMQFIYIPLITFIAMYIFLKKIKFKFSYVFIALAVLLLLYSIIIIKLPVKLDYIQSAGYTMNFLCSGFINWACLFFNTVVFFMVLHLFQGKNIDKYCIVFVLISTIFSIIEVCMLICNSPLMVQPVLGEALWLLTFIYALNKVKK